MSGISLRKRIANMFVFRYANERTNGVVNNKRMKYKISKLSSIVPARYWQRLCHEVERVVILLFNIRQVAALVSRGADFSALPPADSP